MKRTTWEEYFITVMDAVSKRSTCDRGRSGCVIVKNNQILSTGYVGSLPGLPHCDVVGHELEDGHCVRTVHAEQNAIYNAAKLGIPLNGATLYCRMTPCKICAIAIIQSGIKHVICEYRHKDYQVGYKLFFSCDVTIKTLKGDIEYEK